MAAACALAIISGRIIFNFGATERLRAFRCSIFTEGVWNELPQSKPDGFASSPKGTPYGNAGNFIATAKSRPLGEGGIAVGDDGRGIPGKQICILAAKFAGAPEAPSPRELAKPSGFD